MPTCSPWLSLCHLQVLLHLKHPSLIFFRMFYSTQTTAVCSSCSHALLSWLLRTVFLEYLAQVLLTQATVVWCTQVKREAEHRARGLNCRSLLLGQSDMKDKNSLPKDIKWHNGNTTMQYSTQNSTRCRSFYATASQPKLTKIISQKVEKKNEPVKSL